MAASILSLVNAASPVVGASRSDLRPTDTVTVSSVNAHTTYSWSLAYVPLGSAAAFSGDITTAAPGDFTVDLEGPYLVRLVADVGLPTQTEQFVALRFLTLFGDLQLVAAGEQNQSPIPVPVDATTTGWADTQNTNFQVILGFLAKVSASGRFLYVDPNAAGGVGAPDPVTGVVEGYGDYDEVQAAIDAANTAGASASAPWLVLVRPGLYVEDLTFRPHIHVVGWPGSQAGGQGSGVFLRCANVGSTGTHEIVSTLAADRTVISNVVLENNSSSPTAAALRVTGPGQTILHRCRVAQNGIGATVGAALGVEAGTVLVDSCQIFAAFGAFNDRVAVAQTAASTLLFRSCQIEGTSGMDLNPSLVFDVRCEMRDTQVRATGAGASWAVRSSARSLLLEYSRIEVATGSPVLIHPSAAAFAGGSPDADVSLQVRWSFIEGAVSFDTTGITGDTTLELGASEYTAITLPGGGPTNLTATVKGTSLFYDNATTAITAENVQDAIDEVHALAVLVTTLDDAYDGGVGGGLGRRILADSGAVEIVDAPAPSVPPPAGNSDGRLRVVGGVEIGSITEPELDLDPNPFGSGPMLRLGRLIVPNNAPFLADAHVMGRSTGTPNFRNFNLRLQTESSEGGTRIGRLIARGGDAFDNGGSTPDAGSVFVQAGTAKDGAAGEAGSVYIAPGLSAFGSDGNIVLVRSQDATPATLTATGAFVGGVTGSTTFATDMGGFTVAIDAADNLAAVLVKLNAVNQVTAVDVGGGVIELTTFATGLNALIYYLGDTVGGALDTAMGVFDTVSQVDGTWPSSLHIQITANNEITFGVGGATGPMIYNADTGKLTVPGIIDPTGLILNENAPLTAPSSKGVIFVGDGTGGTTIGNLYYVHESGSLEDISAAVLAAGTVATEDEGISVDLVTATLNFVGEGVTATSAGSGIVDVTIPKLQVEREEFTAASFVGGALSTKALSSTPDIDPDVDGVYNLLRNGVGDMTRVGGVPATRVEWRINGTDLEIGTDITGSGNLYEVVYPNT